MVRKPSRLAYLRKASILPSDAVPFRDGTNAEKSIASAPQHVVDSKAEALERSPDLDPARGSAPADDWNLTVTSDSPKSSDEVSASSPVPSRVEADTERSDVDAGEGDQALNDWEDEGGRVPLPKLSKPQLERLKFAIVTSLASGSPVSVICANYRVDSRFVERCRNIWLDACRIQEAHDWEHELKVKSIDAIRDGLDCRFDQYKRMNSAIKVLQGLGYFKQDAIAVNILQKFENVPAEFRDRYMSTDDPIIEVPSNG